MNNSKAPFKDVNNLLEIIVSEAEGILGEDVIGIYLYGSLVWGGFNRARSDIDLLVVLKTDVSDEQFQHLDQMHRGLSIKFPTWNDRIEIAYVSLYNLNHSKTAIGKIAVISPGEPFNIKNVGKEWLINYYLIQTKSIVLLGVDPKTIIEPISKEEFIANVKEQTIEWRDWIGQTKRSIGYQYYAVLTICRAFYVLNLGKQPSKYTAAKWMLKQFPQWKELIERALLSLAQNHTDITGVHDPQLTYKNVYTFVNEVIDLIEHENGN